MVFFGERIAFVLLALLVPGIFGNKYYLMYDLFIIQIDQV